MRGKFGVLILIVFCSMVSARYLDPCLDPATAYQQSAGYLPSYIILDSAQCITIKAQIEATHEDFVDLTVAYYEHLSGHHGIYAGYRLRKPFYPDTATGFYAEGADGFRFQGLNDCLDSLTIDMCRWIGNFNWHVEEYHPDPEQLQIPFSWAMPRVYMTYQECLDYKHVRMVKLVEAGRIGLSQHLLSEHDDSTWSVGDITREDL